MDKLREDTPAQAARERRSVMSDVADKIRELTKTLNQLDSRVVHVTATHHDIA